MNGYESPQTCSVSGELQTKYCNSVNTATRWQWLCLSMLLCLCATLSKETGFTAVAVCIVLDYFIEHKVYNYNYREQLAQLCNIQL